MHSGHHRRHAGGQEGAARLHRWRPRECTGLARTAARFEGPRSSDRARTRRRRRCAWVLEGARRDLADHTRAALLGAQTANVLNKLPKSQQPKAKRSLQEIWMAETSKDAEAAFDAFIAAYMPKYDKAAKCLAKDRQALLAFYDLP